MLRLSFVATILLSAFAASAQEIIITNKGGGLACAARIAALGGNMPDAEFFSTSAHPPGPASIVPA